MTDPPSRRWKLWHLTALVLASALLLAAIRALIVEKNQMIEVALAISIIVGIYLALHYLGTRVIGRATRALRAWGLRRGGVAGFCAWAAGITLGFATILVAVLIGPVVAIAILIWLFFRT